MWIYTNIGNVDGDSDNAEIRLKYSSLPSVGKLAEDIHKKLDEECLTSYDSVKGLWIVDNSIKKIVDIIEDVPASNDGTCYTIARVRNTILQEYSKTDKKYEREVMKLLKRAIRNGISANSR